MLKSGNQSENNLNKMSKFGKITTVLFILLITIVAIGHVNQIPWIMRDNDSLTITISVCGLAFMAIADVIRSKTKL
jgi:hypothetical protein